MRDSTATENDYSLSLVSDNKIYHYQIHQKYDGVFHIDDGPVIQGKVVLKALKQFVFILSVHIYQYLIPQNVLLLFSLFVYIYIH